MLLQWLFLFALKQTTVATSYSKFVSREMSKAEALLKGLKKADQQAILDDFNKQNSSIRHPSVAPSVAIPSAPPAPAAPTLTVTSTTSTFTPSSNTSASVAIASREDVLTRAAALGKGAATTGFKRFLALTEAAKDRKDGPFRKLFNP
ncbi:hypothetical protein B296_00018510 [Ensete ventricosum]|uniref:Uncharacterized protein n=1 Tax=Ensete ventricosum TaxID=4639 RepID=A0A426Y4D6_ENSVE|nr:hypothetical protein B296_00018510 [Ensete ventricosum]